MFDFFKSKGADDKPDAKGIREAILQFIKEELQQLDGGEGTHLQTIVLSVAPSEEERHLYDAALYAGDEEKLQEDVQRIADNFVLNLPADWNLTLEFRAELPAGCIHAKDIDAALKLIMASVSATASSGIVQALITVLKGKTGQDEYTLSSANRKRINIGRERYIEAKDGSFRINNIAFPDDPTYEDNKFISRQHAHIEWDAESACFKLYADEGGVPPRNKTKLRSALDESVNKLNSTQIGYPIRDGDQIILGDAAVLEFTIIT